MTIRLHVRRMRVVRVVEDQFDKLVIEVADTRRVVWYPACGCKTSKVHETRRVEIRDLPRAGRRRWCGCSGASSAPMWTSTHTEDHPEIEGKVARRLARWLVRDSKYLTIRGAVAPAPLVVALDRELVRSCAVVGPVDARAGVGCR